MYNRMTEGYDCDRLSHLIYRLHSSLDYKQKFLLVTRIFEFKDDLSKSEELSSRILASVDPEFIYLLLRSSTIFKIIGLEVSNLLLCNKKNAKHMRKLVVYVTEILETNKSRKDFVYDASTKAISEQMGEYDIVWMRLIYQSLTCLERLCEYLGPDYVYNYTTDVNELNESVEYLLNDMFDISLQTDGDGGLDVSGVSSISTKTAEINDYSCELCELLRKNEFKDEAMKLEELYKDLDSLAKAHLEELDMQDVEEDDSEYETDYEDNNNTADNNNSNTSSKDNKREKNKNDNKEKKSNLLNVVEGFGGLFLEEMKEKSKDVCLDLSCIVILFKILPGESRVKFVKKCLDSSNFDVIKTIVSEMESVNLNRTEMNRQENRRNLDKDLDLYLEEIEDLEPINELLYKYCVGILDSNMTRENVVFLLRFIKERIESIESKNYNRSKEELDNLEKLENIDNMESSWTKERLLELLKVSKRCEIEIYLSLEEVFRKEEVVISNIPFETMESVMSVISNIEEPFENMDEFFSIFHRTVQVLFDYFDNLYENRENKRENVEKNKNDNKDNKADEYKTCVVRLLSCWMTLESMHFHSQYLQKLPKILRVISEMDFIWLLPTFNYIEVSDLYNMDLLLFKLVSVVSEVSKLDFDGEISRNTVLMSCDLLQRLHLDPLVDYKKMLKKFDENSNSYTTSNKDNRDSNSSSTNKTSTTTQNTNSKEEKKDQRDRKDLVKQLSLVDYYNNKENFNFEGKLVKQLLEVNKYLNEGSSFTPKCPLEYLVPICINLDESNGNGNNNSYSNSYRIISSVVLELLFKLCKKSKIKFVKEFMEGRLDFKQYLDDISKEYEHSEEFDVLIHVTLATVSSCMGRVYESSFLRYYGNGVMMFLLELTVFFFLHTSPRSSREYLYEENNLELFYSFCRLSVLLTQNYPTFVKLFNYSVKKVGLKIAAPLKEDFEKIVEGGLASEEDLVLSEFFSMYTSSL